MINVASSRAALAGMKAKFVVLPADQVDEMLSEVERGQQARIALRNLNDAGAAIGAAGAAA